MLWGVWGRKRVSRIPWVSLQSPWVFCKIAIRQRCAKTRGKFLCCSGFFLLTCMGVGAAGARVCEGASALVYLWRSEDNPRGLLKRVLCALFETGSLIGLELTSNILDELFVYLQLASAPPLLGPFMYITIPGIFQVGSGARTMPAPQALLSVCVCFKCEKSLAI